MLNVRATLRKLSVSKPRLDRALNKAIDLAIPPSVEAWVQTAAKASSRYTGQTYAALNLVGSAYGVSPLPTSPINAKAAKMAATSRYSKSNVGTVTKQGNQYYKGFKFNTTVPQIWFNEYTEGLPSPPMKVTQPWRAITKANVAFTNRANSIIRANMPKFADIIEVKTTRVG